jgi:vacuolar-type H+-ATPase subunit C/Vma6
LQIQHIDFNREYAFIEDNTQRAEKIKEKKRELFIPKGRELNFEKFFALSDVGEIEDVVLALAHMSCGPALQQVMPRFYDSGSLAILQRKMEELALKKGLEMYTKGPLTMGIIAGYIWAKFNEVVNLRIIIRGKAIGMLERRIREELLLV